MIRRHLILVVDSHFTLVLKAFVTALEVSDDAVGYRSIYCMNVFIGSRTYAIQGFHWQASDVHIFQKLSRMGGRAVLTLAQSTRNESVEVARLEFLKRNHGENFGK